MDKTLSIIIPMYKGQKYIKTIVERIKSIATEKEILIVDDGSPDDSLDYCINLFGADEEVVIVHKENGGIASARNVGLAKANGKYVLFVDQDDDINPETVVKTIDYMECNHLDIAFWTTEFRDAAGRTWVCDKVFQEKMLLDDRIVQELITGYILVQETRHSSYLGHVWGGLFAKALVERNNLHFLSFIDYEDDYLFVFDALLVAKRVGFVQGTGYYWLVNNESHSRRKRVIPNYIEKSEKMFEYINNRLDAFAIENINRDLIVTYGKQKTILDALRNACSEGISDIEVASIKKALKRDCYKESMNKPCAVLGDFRFRLLYLLVKHNFIRIATVIIRINNFCKKG